MSPSGVTAATCGARGRKYAEINGGKTGRDIHDLMMAGLFYSTHWIRLRVKSNIFRTLHYICYPFVLRDYAITRAVKFSTLINLHV